MLAVDVGGTKVAAGLVGGDGRILARRQTTTRGGGSGPDEIFDNLWSIVAPLVDQADVMGVGCGGPMDRGPGDRRVSPLHIPQWEGLELAERLVERSGLDVIVDNDAKALALGEGWCGAAAGQENFLALVVSTGVGGGIVLDGRLLDGATDNAGHIGHIVVDPDGAVCACGSRGCLEAVASGTAIAEMIGAPAANASDAVRRSVGMMVGRGVATVVNLLDLPLAVVAGSVALGFGKPFFDAATVSLRSHCGLAFTQGAQIVPAGLGADGPLVGAAAVWHHHAGDGVLSAGQPVEDHRG
ncbi:MAG: ROK family protein [Acidimicrobiales bacterium]|nr:ROK family protein [Acidimicrobiales bacterium]